MQFSKKLKEWYRGKHIKNNPNSRIMWIGFYDQHWSARTVEAIWEWTRKDYKWLIGIAVAILVVPFGIYLQSKVTGITETEKNYYIPRLSNQSNLRTANCWESLSSTRSDAFRCSVDNYIYDPCFKSTELDSKLVGCPDSPNGEEDTFIFSSDEKQKTIPEIFDDSDTSTLLPWFLILSNGQTCRYITGASEIIADKRMDYGCDFGETFDFGETYLQLPIETFGELLKIRCFNQSKNAIEICSIKEAWF